LTIFVTGGSGGALSIDKVINEIKDDLMEEGYNLIWQTGKHWDGSTKVPDQLEKRIIIERFFNSREMSFAYGSADFVVSRCGAMTLTELAMIGLPAILIPFPYSAEGHQEANAHSVEQAGGAMLLLNKDLNVESLTEAIEKMSDKNQLESMSGNMKRLAKEDAAQEIVTDILTLIR